jgi:hypothetical protein
MLQDVYEKEGPLFFQDFSQYTHKDRQKMNAFDRCGCNLPCTYTALVDVNP